MHGFHYAGDKLCCEGVAVEALGRRYGTPLYVYSQRTLTDHFQALDRALTGVDHLVCFSVKSNSNQSVLRVLARLGSGFDIVSGGELQRVMAAGGDPRRCAFAGVGKTETEIEFALRQGVLTFNAESEPELERINRVAARLRKTAPVALRVNPDVEAHTHKKITTGTYENKFGIAFEMRISSAHRSPARTMALAAEAAGRGIKAIIAGAGMAAHLAGVVAAKTTLPVIGVPMPGGALNGVDALYSTVQMPGGIPVATMAIGKAGARNAGLFVVQILALCDERLAGALADYRREMEDEVERKDAALQATGCEA